MKKHTRYNHLIQVLAAGSVVTLVTACPIPGPVAVTVAPAASTAPAAPGAPGAPGASGTPGGTGAPGAPGNPGSTAAPATATSAPAPLASGLPDTTEPTTAPAPGDASTTPNPAPDATSAPTPGASTSAGASAAPSVAPSVSPSGVPNAAPTITGTTPMNLATDVSLTQSISATFGEAMNAASLTATSFSLTAAGSAPLGGAVTYDAASKRATFNPAKDLVSNTKYTAKVTKSAKDQAGKALAADVIWTFTTTKSLVGQAPVALSTGLTRFVVLAGSTVTNSGLSVVTGDLGLSPGTQVVGFDVPGGPGTLNGIKQIGNSTAAQAKLDLTSAYQDAVSRSTAPISESGNLGGRTLAPGLYKSQTSLAISSGDLTLDAKGDGNAIWIFQMGSTLTTTPGRKVILSGGAKADNVFWQVGSSATLGTTTAFKGNIMAAISITLNTGASLEGRALTQTGAVALNGCTITRP